MRLEECRTELTHTVYSTLSLGLHHTLHTGNRFIQFGPSHCRTLNKSRLPLNGLTFLSQLKSHSTNDNHGFEVLPVPAGGQETSHVSRGDRQTDDDLGTASVSGLRHGVVAKTEIAVLHHARFGGAGTGAATVAEVRPPQALRHCLHRGQHWCLDQQKDGGLSRGK